MPTQEELERLRVWERELMAVGLRSPQGNGTLSSGCYHAWLLLGKRLMEHGAADERFLVDSIYQLAREMEIP
jgi:hypothetical protein